ncbi:Poly-beta-hydroxybutyrate polymerase [Phycisphaerae bacterium RAS1]|nr:Poly-beta-hydroxybutyrate polymerase [Phycisphaerae bacterium RAS1]
MTTQIPWMPTPDQIFGAWQSAMRKVMATPTVMDTMKRVQVGCTPTRTIHREDKMRVLRYESDVEKRFKTPLLFVFALVNRPYILDLKTGKSVVQHFVNRGFDVYNLDWGVPADGDRYLALEDYIQGYMHETIEKICERTGAPHVNLLGYCMGGTMTAMYTAIRPQRVRNLISLTAPFDWSQKSSLLDVWCDEKYFDVDKVIEVYGNAPPHWLQSSFTMLRPVQNLFEKWQGFYDNMEDEKYLEDFFAMETWLNDNIPVAGETFRQFVKYCYQKNLLIQNKFHLGDERVDLKNIVCPMLNLIASNDHLVPPDHSHPLNEAVGSTDRKTMVFPAGHIGMAVSSRAHRDLWPKVCDWLEERSEPVG